MNGAVASARVEGSQRCAGWRSPTTASPAQSTATHSELEAHEMPVSPPGTGALLHARAPAVGRGEVITPPSKIVAAQNPAEGQETPLITPSPTRASRQARAPAAGLLEVTSVPASPTATQLEDVAQETASSR